MQVEAIAMVRDVVAAAIPYVMAFALCGKAVQIVGRAMFGGKLRI